MDLFNIDPGLAIWTWITFGILFFLLSKFAFPTLLKNLKNREEMIAQSVDDAAQIKKQLFTVEKEREEILKLSRLEADEILRRTKEEAQRLRKNLLEKAEREAQELLNQAREKINKDRTALMESIRMQIADFACNTAEQIIGRSFVPAEDRKWAEDMAKTL